MTETKDFFDFAGAFTDLNKSISLLSDKIASMQPKPTDNAKEGEEADKEKTEMAEKIESFEKAEKEQALKEFSKLQDDETAAKIKDFSTDQIKTLTEMSKKKQIDFGQTLKTPEAPAKDFSKEIKEMETKIKDFQKAGLSTKDEEAELKKLKENK